MNEIDIFMDFSNPVFQLIISVLLGAFVGIRREVDLQKEKSGGFRGLRTTALVTVLGTVSTLIPQIPFLPLVAFIGIIIGVALVYRKGLTMDRIGMTSEISLILMFLSGVFIGYGEFMLGIILAIIVALSDAYKNKMHEFAKNMKLEEWKGTLEMLIISLVILPFLPETAIDPWGAIIPYNVWLLVVLVTGIGFVGYFLNKFFKNSKIKGVYLTSFLGSLISSTVVTVQLSQKIKSRNHGGIKEYFVPALILAIAVMEIRILVLILITTQQFNFSLIAIPLFMAITAFIFFIIFYLLNKGKEKKTVLEVKESSPFEIIPALKFALFFVIALLIVHFAKEFFGDGGVYITAVLIALIDVETIVLPILESFKERNLDLDVVVNVLSIVLIINTLVKLIYVWIFANKEYFFKVLIPILLIGLSGFVTLFLL